MTYKIPGKIDAFLLQVWRRGRIACGYGGFVIE